MIKRDIEKLRQECYEKISKEFQVYCTVLSTQPPHRIIECSSETDLKRRICNVFEPQQKMLSEEALFITLQKDNALDILYSHSKDFDLHSPENLLNDIEYRMAVEYTKYKDNQVRVFVDMDGCLAEFKQPNRFEDLFEKNYFLNLRPHANIVETVKALDKNQNYEVYILSSVLQESKYAKQEKALWLKQYLPELNEEQIIFSQCNKSKVAFVPNGIKETDILLDDYNLNLKEWKLAGARPIKVVNGINDKHHSWSGLRINYMESASDSIDIINSVANTLQYTPVLPNEVNISPSEPSIGFLY